MLNQAAAVDRFLISVPRRTRVREEFDPSNKEHQKAIMKYVETGIWETSIDIYGSHNVPYDAMKKTAYYACKYNRIK